MDKTRLEILLEQLINNGSIEGWECRSRLEEYLVACINKTDLSSDYVPRSRLEELLKLLLVSIKNNSSDGTTSGGSGSDVMVPTVGMSLNSPDSKNIYYGMPMNNYTKAYVDVPKLMDSFLKLSLGKTLEEVFSSEDETYKNDFIAAITFGNSEPMRMFELGVFDIHPDNGNPEFYDAMNFYCTWMESEQKLYFIKNEGSGYAPLSHDDILLESITYENINSIGEVCFTLPFAGATISENVMDLLIIVDIFYSVNLNETVIDWIRFE